MSAQNADTVRCGAVHNGQQCILPYAHNMGRLDIPENHQFPTAQERATARCEQVGHDWRPKMDGPECLRCGARNGGEDA